MKTITCIFMVVTKANVALVRQREHHEIETLSKQYFYNTDNDAVKKGDLAVAFVGNAVKTEGEFKLIIVTEVCDEYEPQWKRVIGTIDTDKFFKAEEDAARALYIRKELDRRQAALSEQDKYKNLAAQDAEAAKMLEELAKLRGE